MHFVFRTPNTTFWFAPGVHTLGPSEFGQIAPGSGTTFVGAPGAILDGQRINRFAFTKLPEAPSTNVTIRYLTIRNFVSPLDQGVVNHDSQSGWTIEFNTVHFNEGGGVFLGSDNVLRYNCLADNGQYGLQALGPFDGGDPTNILIDHNEVARNNTGDWESRVPGCGCTGGAKFWLSNQTTVTNNWVHDNRSVGLWFDNNNRGALVAGNLIENNAAEGLFFEAGYDFLVHDNLLRRNALVKGRAFQSRSDPFPVAAIYVSESGAPAGYGLSHVPSVIRNNSFQDNWGGVALWENADRYSGSGAHTHVSGTIKIGDLHSDDLCQSSNPDDNNIPDGIDPYLCRWSTENVIVENNEFHIDKTAVGTGCVGGTFCGISGIFSNFGTFPEFSGFEIPWRITFQQGNLFRNNAYFGDWRFAGFETARPDGSRVPWSDWIAPAPPIPPIFTSDNRPLTFGQDGGSTYNDVPPPPPSACTSKKLSVAGKNALAEAKCHSTTVKKGIALDPACLPKADATFSQDWPKAEAPGDCLAPTGDEAAIAATIDAFVDDIVTDLVNAPGPSKCTSKKLTLVGKSAKARLKCHAKAANKGVAVDPTCLFKASEKLGNGWFQAETMVDCQTTLDGGQINAKVVLLVEDIVDQLLP